MQGEAAGAAPVTVPVTAQTRLLRTAPGETTLKNAAPLDLTDLAVGDRVLIRPAADGSAATLIAMKGSDIAQKREGESADWQRRGVAGIVDTADAGTITLKAQGGAPATTIHATATTVVRRYAPGSVSFADTVKGTLADIRPGDQLRARGSRDDSGAVTAEEIVAGSFRNVTGTVLSVDPAAHTLTLTDLATKKPETLHLEPTAQLRKLPPELAARLARRGGANTGGPAGGASPAASTGGPANGPDPAGSATGNPPRPHGGAGGDLLARAPSITLADLHKGDAVMVVASGPGSPQPIAITVIAGVEPLLQASPQASANLFSSSWNLGSGSGSGGGEGGGAPQ